MTFLFAFLLYFPRPSDERSPPRVTATLPLALIIWTMPHNCVQIYFSNWFCCHPRRGEM